MEREKGSETGAYQGRPITRDAVFFCWFREPGPDVRRRDDTRRDDKMGNEGATPSKSVPVSVARCCAVSRVRFSFKAE